MSTVTEDEGAVQFSSTTNRGQTFSLSNYSTLPMGLAKDNNRLWIVTKETNENANKLHRYIVYVELNTGDAVPTQPINPPQDRI